MNETEMKVTIFIYLIILLEYIRISETYFNVNEWFWGLNKHIK